MKLKILDRFERPSPRLTSTIFLTLDNWNDFSFYTLFGMSYVDEEYNIHEIGAVKVAFFGQKESERAFYSGDTFEKLDDNYFSLGQSDEYYSNLNSLGDETRDEILFFLNDIAKNEDLFEKVANEKVVRVSLFRVISPSTVKIQYRRISNGGARLTEYNFRFIAPKMRKDSSNFDLTFEVDPESLPPTNIHVLIGRNGVGKTHLTNNMISSLLDGDEKTNGSFEFDYDYEENKFANLISVSFSAFDDSAPHSEVKDKTKGMNYSYIGLKQFEYINDKTIISTKSNTKLKNEFYRSLEYCRSAKKERWKFGIEILESDPYFRNSDIKSLIEIEDDIIFKKRASEIFLKLSSGHKVVILTITKLIETLQEKSLVLLDEPEAHLHPPLLSAFIRALSELLTQTNGVAIIATHSPVILQEVPKNCAWRLSRSGAEAKAERLKIETFGENVGILTNEVFGLEVTNSGFYELLDKVAKQKESYEEVVNHFNGQLGMEAKAILMTYFV